MNRGMTVCDGITVKQFVIPLPVSGIYAGRYRGGMIVRGGMTVKQFVIPLLVSGIYAGRYRE
ncbi:hypothetical protein [Wolbachia endosymbiont of Aedes albopictus]|uniref:hypothetical protein n=1 Tax=Wolbachia endosymbiont of Aedes albopictus TaxID=167957 RepID=UPI002169E0B9|nr:hypothetical protein [Wolbachia endosymbiont of Aedes albopictus]UVW83481.1 hypothetical protein NHG98_03785 [Wolbachia endosymbiont of Aedes albopictus]